MRTRRSEDVGEEEAGALTPTAGSGGGRRSRPARAATLSESQQLLQLVARKEQEVGAAAERRAAAEQRLREAAEHLEAARREEQQLLAEAAQARERAAVAAELEAQSRSALLQLLLGQKVVPMVASFLLDGADKLSLALSCKALLRQFRRAPAQWLHGLSLRLAPADAAGQLACQLRVQRLLQLQPPAAVHSLEVAGQGWSNTGPLMQLVGQLRGSLRSLHLRPKAPHRALEGTYPQLTALALGIHAGPVADFQRTTPRLRSLRLSNYRVQELPPGLTRLGLVTLRLAPEAAASLCQATTLRALSMHSVKFEGLSDLAALSALTGLTSLKVARLQGQSGALVTGAAAVPIVAAMPRLRELVLIDAPPNVLSQFTGQLSKLELAFSSFAVDSGLPALADLTRLTGLRSLTLVGYRTYETLHDQLSHIPHLALL